MMRPFWIKVCKPGRLGRGKSEACTRHSVEETRGVEEYWMRNRIR
jgi:hypothetical protein